MYMYEIIHTNLISKITYSIYNFIEYFARDDKTKTISVSIPSDILYRSQLICEYIKGEIDEDFDLDNLLMILYMNFIKECVKNYNPKSVYALLNKTYYDTKNIIISDGKNDISIARAPVKLSVLELSISTMDFKKGQLILDEIYELYHSRYSFSKLLESLWMDLIYSYKTGQNKRAYHSIIKMLEKCLS